MLITSKDWSVQPSGTAALHPTLAGLGFTHAWSWSDGPDLPSNRLSGNQLSIGAGSATATPTPQGRGLYLSGSNTQRLTVGSNPFGTSTCTILVVEALSGDGSLSQGQVLTDSRYSATSQANNTGSLQFRKVGQGYQTLRAQVAVTLSATNCRVDGMLNAAAVTVAGNNGRHAIIANGFLAGEATPTATYTHGTSAIGNSTYIASSQEVRMSGPLYFLAFAPKVIPDAELVRLTSRKWGVFAPRRIWVPVSLASSNVTVTGTPGNAVAAGTSATVNQARAVTGTTGNAAAAGVTAQINQARSVTGAVGNAVAAGVAARVNLARSITGTTGNAVAAGVAATITTTGAVVVTGTPGNAVAAGVTARINQARSITGIPGNATAAGVHATITTAAGVTITAAPGNAVAAGVTATFRRNVAITAGPGNAVAAGVTATVSNGEATRDGEGGGEGRIRRGVKPKRKPKFLIEVDGKFVVVDSPEEARQVLSPKPVKKGKKAAKKAVLAPVVPVIDLGQVEDYADLIGEIEQFDAAMQSRHYQQILAMFDQMQRDDDEDVELLLLAL